MILLEFMARTLLGRPTWHSSDSSQYECPCCGRNAFVIRPHSSRRKDRWKCYACSAWGDELDLLKYVFPKFDYQRRLEMLEKMRTQYEAAGGSPDIPLGSNDESDPVEIGRAIAESRNALEKCSEADPLFPLVVACDAADRHGVSLADMAQTIARNLMSDRDHFQRHVFWCTDSLCGNSCREARGLRPLSEKERKKLKEYLEEVAYA